MARLYVTPELGEAVRSIRQQNKITGKNVAKHLGKSQAFITRLENSDLATVDQEELWEIFSFISNGDLSQNEKIEKIFQTLKVKFSPEEINQQVWFMNYDTVVRQIPIPIELIDEITDRMNTAGIDSSYLLSRINANESISEEQFSESDAYNTWYSNDETGNEKSIKIQLSKSDFDDILSKKADVTSYIFLLSIAYYLIKCEKFSTTVKISHDENVEIMDEATDLLNKHKFYSLSSREQVLSNAKTREEYNQLLSSFDSKNVAIINSILSALKFYSDSNIKLANNQLSKFVTNLNWDPGFMMKLISFDFFSITNVSYSCKSELLNKISLLIKELLEMPDEQKNIETY